VFTFTETQSICDGQTYSWQGSTYNTAGTYTASYTTVNGCDSIYTLNLTVNPVYAFTETQSICDGQTYSWQGSTYTTAGTYTASYTTANGCDSIYTLNLTVNPVYAFTETQSICDGQSYTWQGSTYNTAGTYTASYTTTYGCDSIYTLNLATNANPILTITSTTLVVCNGNSVILEASGANTYSWNTGQIGSIINVNPTSNTVYTVTGTDNNGCTGTEDISINVFQTTPIDAGPGGEICPGGSLQLNATGALSYSWTPISSLDNTTVSNPTATPTSTTTYYLTGLVQGNNIIQNGDFNTGNFGFSSQYIYDTNLWPEGNYYITSNPYDHQSLFSPCGDHTTGTDSMMVVNGAPNANQQVWCQSIMIAPNYDYIFSTWLTSVHPNNPAILQFSINGVLLGTPFTTTSTTCNWQQFYEIWNAGVNTTAEICIVNQNTIQNGNDFAIDDIFFSPICPLTDSVTVIVNETYSFVENQSICESNTFIWHGNNYNTTGIYYDSLLTVNGCDSVYVLNLTVDPEFEYTENQEICDGDSFLWHGNSYAIAGTYYDSLLTVFGCDSVYILNLTVHPVYEFAENQQICDGDSFLWHGNSYVTAGTYYDSLLTVYGCDSVYVLNLTVNAEFEYTENEEICESDTFMWHGNNYNTTGVYYDSLLTVNGCDSVYVLNLTVHPEFEYTENQEICDGDSFLWHGNSYAMAGTYYDSLLTVFGCDSVYILNLTVHPVYEFAENQQICDGDSFLWHGNSYAIAGTYYDSLLTVYGCDSVYILNLTVNPVPTVLINGATVICNGDTALLTATGGTAYLWNTGDQTANITVHPNIASTYLVTVTNLFGCTESAQIQLTVNPLPQVYAGSDQIVCLGQSVNFTAYGGGTYIWSNGSTLQSINVTPQATTAYSVTATDANGCSAIDSAIVTVNALPNIQAGPDSSICIGNTLQLYSGGGTTYNWAPAGSLNNAAISNPVSSTTVTTTYTVTVTDNNGCINTDTVVVTINQLPVANAGSNQNICLNDTLTLSASGGLLYHWNTGQNTASLMVSPANTSTYTVTVTDVNGCSNTDDVVVTVHALPLADAGSDTSVCFNSAIQLSASGGISYLWTPSASLNDNTISNPMAEPLQTTTYTVTVTDTNGCSANDHVIVVVHPLPLVFGGGHQGLCMGDSASFTASGGVSYIWNTGDTTQTIIVAPTVNTTYTVTATDIMGCVNTDNAFLTAYPLPNASAGNDTGVCSGSFTQLNGGGGISYLWSPAAYLNAATIQNPISTPSTNITYTVTVTDSHGCSATDDVVVVVYPDPVVYLMPSHYSGCAPLVVNFSDTNTVGIISWLWDFGDPGSTSNTSSLQNPTHIYQNSGIYSVSLTLLTSNGCQKSFHFNNIITVFPGPIAAFDLSPSVTNIYMPTVSFHNNSINAVSWYWDFGDTLSNDNHSVAFSPTHTYSKEGTYTIKLLVFSQNGCIDSCLRELVIEPEFTFFIPNAFTPNGDGINDYFQGYGTNFTDYEMLIFDRWGELTYETHDYGQPWNGKYWNVNEITFGDVFVYKINVVDFRGMTHYYIGHVTLVR